MPMAATWDDHDYGDNDASGDYPYKAATTPLSVWRAILFWPLALCEGGFKVSDPAWREIGDRLDHLPPADASQENHPYAEFVYFHEYVQTALFGAAGDCARDVQGR